MLHKLESFLQSAKFPPKILVCYYPDVLQAKEKLFAGEELDDVFVGEIILEKLHSPEVHHYGTSPVPCAILLIYTTGYVLDCLPCMTTGWKSVEEQLSFLKDLQLKPDVVINLKVVVTISQ